MADSGGSTSNSSPWWKSLTRKKSKEVTVGAQPHGRPEAEDHTRPCVDRTSSSGENQHSDVLVDTGEPPGSDKLGEEKSGNNRRNLKISRSGRFKEKRKVRATLLPEGDRSPEEEADFPDDPQEDKQ
ncbi:proline-rich protein 15 [Alexandromys fortis]|uniref:proline-rich protein 15 n=1 Tax=Alexandromys fortis TaxID=100897 RepID=UPI0021530D2B|nr:proline-rich protein 15 [Microtus fortis]XP_050011466.1 proline-rich protein 15 [Microtus fortis]